MKTAQLLILAILAMFMVSCRRSDIKEAIISVPEMRNRACADIIVRALSSQIGVKGGPDIKIDLVTRTVTVEYESLVTALKNVEYAIAKAGFSANEIPADPEAAKKLPEACFTPGTTIDLPGIK